jgi:hypothetical protein
MKPSRLRWKSSPSVGGLQRKHGVGFGDGNAVVACGTATRGGSWCCLRRVLAPVASLQVSGLYHVDPPVCTHGCRDQRENQKLVDDNNRTDCPVRFWLRCLVVIGECCHTGIPWLPEMMCRVRGAPSVGKRATMAEILY